MTREEADQIATRIYGFGSGNSAVRLVDTLEALGILKLEKSLPTAIERAQISINAHLPKPHRMARETLDRILKDAGVRIIDTRGEIGLGN